MSERRTVELALTECGKSCALFSAAAVIVVVLSAGANRQDDDDEAEIRRTAGCGLAGSGRLSIVKVFAFALASVFALREPQSARIIAMQ